MNIRRTHLCGSLSAAEIGATVTLTGWVNTYRSQSKALVFIDVRDYSGLAQILFDEEDCPADVMEAAAGLRREDVIAVQGTVRAREKANPKLATGAIEVLVSKLEVLSKTEKPPILPEEREEDLAAEEARLTYRYIDLRRPRMQEILRQRHRVTKATRDFFDRHGFIEIETPILLKTTPEGARDFIVPSRHLPGHFYALPQSPQILKQLLMMSGCDRYMQICKCFRDEDQRADRQPEFSQIDLEMSFVTREDIFDLMSDFLRFLWKETMNVDIGDIPRLSHAEVMERFGIDKPDMRFGLELIDISDLAAKTDFRVFADALAREDGVVKAIRVPAAGETLTRKLLDGYSAFVKDYRAGGVPYTKVVEGGFETGVARFLEPIADDLQKRMQLQPGDVILFGADTRKVASAALGNLRNRVARDLGLIPPDSWSFLWVVDFPMFAWNEEESRWESEHHPFVMPRQDHIDRIETDPGNCMSSSYDVVINGYECASGSIRIHRPDIQQKVFNVIGMQREEAEQKFGFLMNAMRFGAPPHGGLAFGLDRFIMLMMGTDNIRDVIAFPKTAIGADLMSSAPSPADAKQLEELGIALREHAVT
ncbi:MAG: aspartate--tRNA ligase [Phycisphaerales bacterium]